MKGRSTLFITGLAVVGALVASTPAAAAPLEKERFNDAFTDFFTCESTGTPVQHDADYWINFHFNLRGVVTLPVLPGECAGHGRVHQPGHRRHVHHRLHGERPGP